MCGLASSGAILLILNNNYCGLTSYTSLFCHRKPGVLGSVPLTTKPQQPSIEDTSASVVNAEPLASGELTSVETKSQKITKKAGGDVTHVPLASESKKNDGLSPKTGVKCVKKKNRETKRVTSKRVRKEKHSPTSGDHVDDVSTAPHATCGAKLLDKQNTANAPKTNPTNTAQRGKIHTRKCLQETRAQQAC